MASITFTGPDPTNLAGPAVSTVVQVDDASFIVTVQSICANRSYQPMVPGSVNEDGTPGPLVPNPVGPGEFTIQCILDFCHSSVIQAITAQHQADAAAKAATDAAAAIAAYKVPTLP